MCDVIRNYCVAIIIIVASVFIFSDTANAQEWITVKGKITGQSGSSLDRVHVYYYKTVDEAGQVKRCR